MSIRLRHSLVGLVVYLAALLAWAPAQLLAPLIERLAASRVAVTGLSGSLWDGRAEGVALRLPGDRSMRLSQVHWRFRPYRLLTGGAPLFVENAAGDLSLAAWVEPLGGRWWGGRGVTGIRLRQLHLVAPLDRLADHAGELARLGLQGQLTLQADDITLARPYAGGASGELRLEAGGAPGIPAGRYALNLDGKGERLAIRWRGPEGAQAMSGTGWWDGRLHLDGLSGLGGR